MSLFSKYKDALMSKLSSGQLDNVIEDELDKKPQLIGLCMAQATRAFKHHHQERMDKFLELADHILRLDGDRTLSTEQPDTADQINEEEQEEQDDSSLISEQQQELPQGTDQSVSTPITPSISPVVAQLQQFAEVMQVMDSMMDKRLSTMLKVQELQPQREEEEKPDQTSQLIAQVLPALLNKKEEQPGGFHV